jgi:Tfp pilus assembly protein FimT
VVAIIGLLVVVAVPNFLDWSKKYKLKDAVGLLQGNMALARMAAINQNTTVTVTVCYQLTPCPGGAPNPAPNQVTVFFRSAAGADVVPSLTMNTEVALTNGVGGVVGAPQDLQFNNRGIWVSTGNGNNLCITPAGSGVVCPGVGQALNFKNTLGVNYRAVVSTTGKISWCYTSDCAQ